MYTWYNDIRVVSNPYMGYNIIMYAGEKFRIQPLKLLRVQ